MIEAEAPRLSASIRLKPEEIAWEDRVKRTCIDEAFIKALGEDIVKRRQKKPIKVRMVEAVKAQLPTLECELIEVDEREAFIVHLVENAYRRDFIRSTQPRSLSTA